MAISRTPKKKVEVQDDDDFGPPLAQVFPDDDDEQEEVETKSADDDKYERLEKLYTELKSQRDEDLDYLRGSDNRSQVVQEPNYVDPNSIKLPDPALEPDAYAAAIEQRVTVRNENERKKADFEAKQKADLQEKIDGLWDAFSKDYPDHAVNNKRVEYVANELAQEAAKQGKDVQRYMFTTRNRFMKDLAERYEEIFGPVEASNDDIDDDPPVRRPRRNTRSRDRDEEDSGRSTGIFGGSNGSSRRSTKSRDDDDKGGFIEDIQKAQRESGFF